MLGNPTAPASSLPPQSNAANAIAVPLSAPVSNLPPNQSSQPGPAPGSKTTPPAVAANPNVPAPAAPNTLTDRCLRDTTAAPPGCGLWPPAAPAATQKSVKKDSQSPAPAKQSASATPTPVPAPAPATTTITPGTTTAPPVPVVAPIVPAVASLPASPERTFGVSLPRTLAQPLPLPGKSFEPHAAPAPESGLAFSARLTPLVSAAADSQANAATIAQLGQAPGGSPPDSPHPDFRFAPPLPLMAPATQLAPEVQSNTAPQPDPSQPAYAAPVPLAPSKEAPARGATTPPTTLPTTSPAVASKTAADRPPQDPPARIAAATATSSTADFNRPFETPAAPSATSTPGARSQSEPLIAALRTSEPQSVAPPQAQTAPVQDITLRIARPEAPSVDLHVTQRAGEIQVSVRTPDTAMQTSLRQDLGTLTNSLERAGYRTDTVIPHAELSSQMDSHEERQSQQESFGRSGSRDLQHGDSPAGDSPQGDSYQGDSHPRDSNGGDSPQPQHHQPDQRPPRWLEALENTK
jgi:hypothetical protein